MKRIAFFIVVVSVVVTLGGCQIGQLIGGMAQNEEYQRKIEVLPMYSDLENQRVAVVVLVDMATSYDFPQLTAKVAGGVSGRICANVPGVIVIRPDQIIAWQHRTPMWEGLPYGDLVEQLNVDRVVLVDVHEYRLNPPGNYWQWEGVCAANIGVIERNGIDPDSFAETFFIATEYPGITGLGRESATGQQIETGLLAEFIKKTAWLFYTHIEPKHPDKYRPELDRS